MGCVGDVEGASREGAKRAVMSVCPPPRPSGVGPAVDVAPLKKMTGIASKRGTVRGYMGCVGDVEGASREGGGRAVVSVRPPNRPSGVQSGSMRNSREWNGE